MKNDKIIDIELFYSEEVKGWIIRLKDIPSISAFGDTKQRALVEFSVLIETISEMIKNL